METKRGYCEDCDAPRKLERPTANHVVHLIITIITMGLWLPVWLMACVRFGGWQCSTCGGKDVHKN